MTMHLITRNGGRRVDAARDEAPQFRPSPPRHPGPLRRACRYAVNEVRWLIELASKAALVFICAGLWAGITARLF